MTEASMNNAPTGSFRTVWPLALVLLALVLGYEFLSILESSGRVSLKEGLEWEDYSALFANLFLIALLIERALEIFYTSPRREPGKKELKRRLETAVPETRETLRGEIDAYRSQTRQTCLFAGFVLGLLCSLAGIQVLGVVLEAGDLKDFQLSLFRSVDVVLTAAILGGGSAGVNEITARMKRFVSDEDA